MKMISLYLRRRWLVSALCYFLFVPAGKSQTGVIVTRNDGTQQNYPVATSGKLYFLSSNLQIQISDASAPNSIAISDIRKITFAAAPLPLRLLDFSLLNEKAQVSLSWKTESEVNTSHFVIERSLDGNKYESIGQVAALNRTTGSNYSFADLSPKNGVSYYRLKQVDADGKYEYSKVLTANRSGVDVVITLLPNPAASYIRINSSSTEKLNVKIFSADGRLMISGTYTSGAPISISQLAPGMYMATINNKNYKLIKQ